MTGPFFPVMNGQAVTRLWEERGAISQEGWVLHGVSLARQNNGSEM